MHDLQKGTLAVVLLKLLADKPSYGYDIIKAVNQRSEGLFDWKEGTLYPHLHRLEAEGLIRGEWQASPDGRQRKYYHLTPTGQAQLTGKLAEWRTFASAMNALLREPPPASTPA